MSYHELDCVNYNNHNKIPVIIINNYINNKEYFNQLNIIVNNKEIIIEIDEIVYKDKINNISILKIKNNNNNNHIKYIETDDKLKKNQK